MPVSNSLSVKLKQITYSGDNLGRELSFTLKIKDQATEIHVKLPHGKSRSFDKVVFQKAQKEKSIILPITAEVREIRERYIDLGSGTSKIKIQLNDKIPRKHTLTVKVQGYGKEKTKTAVIAVVLESTVESAIRYVADIDPNGWLIVKFNNDKKHPIPHMLKVELVKIKNGREYFKILEGQYMGQVASVSLTDESPRFFTQNDKHTGSAKMILDQEAQKLTIVGLGNYNVKIDEHDPLSSTKTYEVEIPDAPHGGGRVYSKDSRYSKTWFRIGHSGERYLHVGMSSLGCIAVTDKNEWTKIYNLLIRSRKDQFSVGEIKVL